MKFFIYENPLYIYFANVCLFVCLQIHRLMCALPVGCLLSVSQNYFYVSACLYVELNCNADGQDGEKAGCDTWRSPHGHCPHPRSQAWAQVCFQPVFQSHQLYQYSRSVSQPCSPAAPLGERLSAAEARRAAIDGLKVDL